MSIPSSVLNTNIASMTAQRNLGAAQTRLAESVERLSSGQRINRAKDDAAGMAVAAVVDTQVKVAGTAHRNINDAISMVQTAEGALQEATGMLQRIKELATQGANDSMSRDQYYFLVQEMRQLMHELANTADRTTFNGNKLLGGGPNATRQVTTTTTTTQTTGVAQNTWTSVDGSGLLTGMTGTIRVIAEVTGGTIKLDSVPAGVNATITGYGNATNGTATSIAFEGSVADVTTALGQLKAQRTGSGAAQVELDAVPSLVTANQWSFNKQNRHYYEAVITQSPISWVTAKSAASASNALGRSGYLATVTSASENQTVLSILDRNAWLGGTDDYLQINTVVPGKYVDQTQSEGNFHWVTGPEAGVLFSAGNDAPITVSVSSGGAGSLVVLCGNRVA
ncbi:MAG: hypothetical protein EBV34_14810 [Betaproteobacteria bacterium]|nr:hypothetical protein [Betaproteobacteria bacterium]